MSEQSHFLAFDFGAESGRAVYATFSDAQITLEEIHRFPTEGVTVLGVRQWNITRIYEEMLKSLALCAQKYGPHLDGIGIDTWGVDFGFIARDGSILGNPIHYRDKRTEGMMDVAFKLVPREEIYKMTGIQFMNLNTLYQLLALVTAKSPVLDIADTFLMMGDLFGYMLSGQRSCEYTNASTTQLLDPWRRTWHDGLIAKLGLPRRLFPELTPPGTILGKILPEVASITGLSPDTPVITPATHDTGSAVAAVPAEGSATEWAYLSSGTWSLLGVELDAPNVSDTSYKMQITNEGGVENTIRFLKNILGLWLVQECRRTWQRQGQQVDYPTMTAEAASAKIDSIIDVDDQRLYAPENMPETIAAICRETGQQVPQTRGETVRCALQSLAKRYSQRLHDIDKVLNRKTQRLHIIGGGTQNKLLNQMTADACGIPVITGPIEATALGNVAVQAMAVGAVGSLAEARKVIAKSTNLEQYMPKEA